MILTEYKTHAVDGKIELWCNYCQTMFVPVVTFEPSLSDLITSANKHAHHAHVRENAW